MKAVTLCVLLFGISQSMPTSDIWEQLVISDFDSIDHVSSFKNWQTRYNKKYNNSDDEAKHFLTFLDNWRMINNHNKKYESGKTTFTMGLNQFGDMTFDEFRMYVHGHSGSCMTQRDDVYHISTATSSNNANKPVISVDSVDPVESSSSSDDLNEFVNEIEKELDNLMPQVSIKDNEIDMNMPGVGEFSFKFGRRLQSVPSSIDWTNINGSTYVTPVKNQGQCGSCWVCLIYITKYRNIILY